MRHLIDPRVAAYLDDLVPERSAELLEMEEWARAHDFPIIGPACGHLCYLLARLTGARRIFELGVIHTALGETYQAFAELERAAGLLSPSTLWIKVDPRLQDLRRHSRFRMLLRDMRLE
jgi:hypothetical protein